MDKEILKQLIEYIEYTKGSNLPGSYIGRIVEDLGGCVETLESLGSPGKMMYINLLFMRSLSDAL